MPEIAQTDRENLDTETSEGVKVVMENIAVMLYEELKVKNPLKNDAPPVILSKEHYLMILIIHDNVGWLGIMINKVFHGEKLEELSLMIGKRITSLSKDNIHYLQRLAHPT